jgi:hypothetical protein
MKEITEENIIAYMAKLMQADLNRIWDMVATRRRMHREEPMRVRRGKGKYA